jgi:hypothetical protein
MRDELYTRSGSKWCTRTAQENAAKARAAVVRASVAALDAKVATIQGRLARPRPLITFKFEKFLMPHVNM